MNVNSKCKDNISQPENKSINHDSNISDGFSFQGSGALICSIDNMPAQIPKEATDFFGNLLFPYIPDMVSSLIDSFLLPPYSKLLCCYSKLLCCYSKLLCCYSKLLCCYYK